MLRNNKIKKKNSRGIKTLLEEYNLNMWQIVKIITNQNSDDHEISSASLKWQRKNIQKY